MGVTEIKLFLIYPMHFPYSFLQFGLQESNLITTFMDQMNYEGPEMHSISRLTNRIYREKHISKKRGNY